MKFKVGNRVKIISYNRGNGEIIAINISDMYLIKHDNWNDGHGGGSTKIKEGFKNSIQGSRKGWYYSEEEISLIEDSLPITTEEYLEKQKEFESKYPIGTKVRVTKGAKSYENGWDNVWTEEMNKNVGKIFLIENYINEKGVELENGLSYPYFVLESVIENNLTSLTPYELGIKPFPTSGRMQVTPEQSKILQEKLFSLKYFWDTGNKEVKYINYPYLYWYSQKRITIGQDIYNYNIHENKEYKFEELFSNIIKTTNNEKSISSSNKSTTNDVQTINFSDRCSEGSESIRPRCYNGRSLCTSIISQEQIGTRKTRTSLSKSTVSSAVLSSRGNNC